MNLGGRILNARKAAGLSQSELEARTKIKREYLSRLENNEHKNPTIGTLEKIATGCGITVVELLGGCNRHATDLELAKAKSRQLDAEERLDEVFAVIGDFWERVSNLNTR